MKIGRHNVPNGDTIKWSKKLPEASFPHIQTPTHTHMKTININITVWLMTVRLYP